MKKEKKTKRESNYRLYVLCAVPVILVFIFNYLPMIGAVIAFKDYKYNDGIFGSKWVGLRNFEMFFKSKDFANVAWNTIYLNFIFIIIGTICAVTLAILLFNVIGRKNVKTYQTIFITPYFISWVVVGYIAYAFLNPAYGILNQLLNALGMENIDVYSKPGLWPIILTIANVWKNVGMDSVIYYAALMGIDTSLFEAADVDGVNRFQKVWYITIPSLISLITILTILKIGNIFRADFGLFYQLTRDVGQLYSTTDVMDTYIYRTLKLWNDVSLSSAAGLLQSVVGLILVVITNTVAKRIDKDCALF
ncbi:MAG: ABC transporter permease subunit [Clostridiales bacterium]|nr:ABC transporter permease subunit [Clostridiales bacterium]